MNHLNLLDWDQPYFLIDPSICQMWHDVKLTYSYQYYDHSMISVISTLCFANNCYLTATVLSISDLTRARDFSAKCGRTRVQSALGAARVASIRRWTTSQKPSFVRSTASQTSHCRNSSYDLASKCPAGLRMNCVTSGDDVRFFPLKDVCWWWHVCFPFEQYRVTYVICQRLVLYELDMMRCHWCDSFIQLWAV